MKIRISYLLECILSIMCLQETIIRMRWNQNKQWKLE